MKTIYTLFVLTCALLAGTVATSLLSGCQKPASAPLAIAPPAAINGNTTATEPEEAPPVANTTAAADAPKPAEEPAKSEPAEEPKKSAESPEPAPKKSEEPAPAEVSEKPASSPVDKSANAPIKPGDWAQWAGTSYRNNTPMGENIPIEWEVGEFDRKTGEWISEDAKNIKWVARVGSQTYGNPVVADGRIYVGTNNGAGWLKRYPRNVDLGCLLAFNEANGKFLWQDSSEKLSTGRVHDWPLQGICCAPLVEGERLWYVTSRGEVKCLDTQGYYDGEDDGAVTAGLARIFDLRRNEDPEADKVAPAIELLNKGAFPVSLREGLASRGVGFPEEVNVETVAEGKKWTITAKLGDAERMFTATIAGPRLSVFKNVTVADTDEADTIWVYNMMTPPDGKTQGISQHNMCSCSVTTFGDILFVNTSNGVDESHINIPAPDAPTFIALDKNTGEIYWSDKSPGLNILHGQWSSPTVAHLGGVDQVIFGGGDGWVYSFKADKGKDGKPELLWKFDANPKASKWILGGRGTRNNIIATPVVYDGLVYVAVGQDPEHGEGVGHVWCLDPTKRGIAPVDASAALAEVDVAHKAIDALIENLPVGDLRSGALRSAQQELRESKQAIQSLALLQHDVSPQLAVKLKKENRVPVEHRRLQAVIEEEGEVAIDNPNSAVVWHYTEFDQTGDGEIDFEEQMHRSCGTVAIQNDLLYIADFSGLFHCLDAKSGKVHWTYDMLAAAWGSPCIVDGHVYIGDEDGDVCIFELSAEPHEPIAEINMGNSVYSTPIVANNILYIANKTHIFAIEAPKGAE